MKIEDMNDAWAATEQLTPTTRIGYGNDWVYIEKTLPDGSVGLYNLAHIATEHMQSFLAWKATLQ